MSVIVSTYKLIVQIEIRLLQTRRSNRIEWSYFIKFCFKRWICYFVGHFSAHCFPFLSCKLFEIIFFFALFEYLSWILFFSLVRNKTFSLLPMSKLKHLLIMLMNVDFSQCVGKYHMRFISIKAHFFINFCFCLHRTDRHEFG